MKQYRIIICTKAVKSTSLLETSWILRRVLLGDWYQFLGCIEFALFVQKWRNNTDKVTYYAQCVAALTISFVRRDERWFQLMNGLLNASKYILNKYIEKGDSILLSNVIFVVRRTIQAYSGSEERHRKEILDYLRGP